MSKKFKQMLSLFLALAIVLSTVLVTASAEDLNSLVFNVTFNEEAAEETIVLQDSVTGAVIEAGADGGYMVAPGTYTYIVRAPLYVTVMDTVEVAGNTTVDVAMSHVPAAELTISRTLGDDHYNSTNNNASGRDMEIEGSGYIGWIRPLSWIKIKDVNLLGGVESYTVNYAIGNNSTNLTLGFDLRVAPSGSSFEDAVSIGALTLTEGTGGWGAPGKDVECTDIQPHNAGVQDLYIVFTSGEYNFGRITLTMKPLPEGLQNYDTTFSVRPYDANVTVTTLDGKACEPTEEGGKVYNLEEGFYRYTVSKEGYKSETVVFPVNAAKRVMAVLLPEGEDNYTRYEAEDAVLSGANIIENAASSGGKKVGGFADTTSFGAIKADFSNISHVEYTVERETTGIVEMIVGYDSSVTAAKQDRIAVKSNDGTNKEVYLNEDGTSSVFVDMRAGVNTIYVSNVVTPRISNDGNAWIDIDYIDVNDVTVPGSIEPSEGDEAYIQPNNPIIKSIFTADPEAHVWPTNPDKLYLYPSHDNYPSAGCDRMDAYHVYSTENMVDWVDEGEILRASDLDWGPYDERPFMWAPDAAYNPDDQYYYFYWPAPDWSTGDWGDSWQTGVRRSRYPDRDFEEIPAEDTYTEDFKGYIEGAGGNGMIDVCVRIFDGQPYIYIGGSQRFFQGKLKDDMVTLEAPLEQIDTTDILPAYHEGPSVFERNGIYYLIYPGGGDSSTGFSGDKFNYAMSDDPLGPWEYKGAFFDPTGCDTSHGSVVEFKGKWYWFYHTMDLSNNGTLRSVCVDEIHFNEDGTIQRMAKTFDSVEQNGPDYVRPEGTVYSMDDAVVSGGAVKSADSSAPYDGKIVTDLYKTGATVTLENVYGGEEGSRAMIVFNYATPDDLPRMFLTANDMNYKAINFPKTGGRSFFSESVFTTKKLNPGYDNTITLEAKNGAGKLTLGSIEIILLDELEDEPDVPSVDKKFLKDLVDTCDSYVGDKFTAESWAAFTEALDAAKAVLENKDATLEEAYDAYIDLVKARDELTYAPDKSLLKLAVELAKAAVNAGGVTDASIEALNDAIEAAQLVLDSEEATQEEINDAYNDVMSCIIALEDVDKSLLERFVKEAEELEAEKYTSESWKDLADALDAAKKVLANDAASETDVKTAFDTLVDAMTNLELISVNKAGLEAAIETAKDILADADKYDPATLAGLEAAVEAAESVLKDKAATQSSVNAATSAVVIATAKVRLSKDVATLESLLDNSKLSEDLKAETEEVIAEVKALLADADVTEIELAEAEKLLGMQKAVVEDALKPAKNNSSKGSVSKVDDNDYWDGVLDKIAGASEGATVNAVLESGAMMPATVLDAAKAKGVNLNLTINDKDYPISAANMKVNAAAVYYNADELIAMAGAEAAPAPAPVAPAAPAEEAANANPETGGEIAMAPEAVVPAAPVEPKAPVTVEPIVPIVPEESIQETAPVAETANDTSVWVILAVVVAMIAAAGVACVVVIRKKREN